MTSVMSVIVSEMSEMQDGSFPNLNVPFSTR